MSSSTASKDRKERQDNSNKQQANEIKKVVNKKLGLTAVGGLGGNNEGFIAANLKGKNNSGKSNKLFYGQEASKFTNDEMVKRGLLSYNEKTGGYSNVVDGKIISNANAIKYGSSNSAMGSGDPTGAMTSIPISSDMLQKQNKIKGLTTAALSLAVPGIGGTVMRASATKNLADAAQPGLAYNDYSQKFDATQKGKKFTSTRNVLGVMNLGLTKGKKSLKDKLGI